MKIKLLKEYEISCQNGNLQLWCDHNALFSLYVLLTVTYICSFMVHNLATQC